MSKIHKHKDRDNIPEINNSNIKGTESSQKEEDTMCTENQTSKSAKLARTTRKVMPYVIGGAAGVAVGVGGTLLVQKIARDKRARKEAYASEE